MTRSELIARMAAKNPALYHRDIERLVGTILDEISGALERGDRVELRGFGAFSVRHRKARIGRNPRTGASVQVAEKKVPFFKMGKGMRERLNRKLEDVYENDHPFSMGYNYHCNRSAYGIFFNVQCYTC